MISVLTLTYQRHHLLEEAIQSYLLQDWKYSQMVIINDSPEVEYVFEHPQIKIVNLKERFSSVGKKLEYGFTQCVGDWVYRLDDDDLLSPYAKELVEGYTTLYPHKDIVRCQKHYFMCHNKYEGLGDSINNGNCYKWNYLKRVGKFIDKSIGEDNWLTFHNNADIHFGKTGHYSMIYRWGMGTYHISGMGDRPNEEIYEITDKTNTESGIIYLEPKFREDYWSQIPESPLFF
jgi:glycosyltransferase involved in cell wall biosynthesis